MADDDVKTLADKYRNLGTLSSEDNQPSDVQSLADKYKNLTPNTSDTMPVAAQTPDTLLGVGAVQGAADVGNTLQKFQNNYIQPTVDRLFKINVDRSGLDERINKVNKNFDEKYGGSLPAQIGRVGGQIAATAPFMPVRALQGVRAVMGAAPTALASGGEVAAPLVNRLMSSVATGGVSGGEFGALTSASNDKSLASNVGWNTLGGMVGGPLIEGASNLVSKGVGAARNAIGTGAVNVFANKYGITPNSAKNILTELENEGMTLQEAENQIISLGKGGTIADLTPGLQTFAGALAQRGGRTTAILKNRYANRAEMADDEARNIMQTNLGPKPDLEVAKQAIKQDARAQTAPDYQAAYASGTKLDAQPIVDTIDKALETAVGDKAAQLKQAKAFLFKDVKNADGSTSKVLKNDLPSLHEVRQALDDKVESLSSPVNTQGSRTLAAVSNIRNELDKVLKAVPGMASADAKFAERMTVMKGLDIGKDALKKGNIEDFSKTFNAASPELKDTIRQGMRAHIGDMMEAASNGELSGAQQLFKKRTATREKLKLAFGPAGEEVLDALARQATLRSTENMVAQGSRTAVNSRINALLDNQGKSSGMLGDFIKGAAIDVSTGAAMPAATILAAKRGAGNILNRASEVRKDLDVESLADTLSRSGSDIKKTLKVIGTVDKIQRAIGSRLPVSIGNAGIAARGAASAPVGEKTYDYGSDLKNRFIK